MKDKEFDIWISSKLSEWENQFKLKQTIDPPVPDWDRMNKMILAEQQDEKLDLKIKSTLQNARIESYEVNWEKFNQWLTLQRERRQKIIKTKVAELSLVLLLIWTLQSAIDYNLLNSPPTNNIVVKNTPLAHNSKLNSTDKVIVQNRNTPSQNELSKQNDKYKKSVLNYSKQSFSRPSSFNSSLNSSKLSVSQDNTINNNSVNGLSNYSEHGLSQSADPTLMIKDQGIDSIQNPTLIEEPSLSSNIISQDSVTINSNTQEFLNKTNSVSPENELDLSTPAIQINKPLNKNKIISIGAGIGYGTFFISNSKHAPNYINEYQFRVNSLSQNFRINLNYTHWIIESGANFTNLTYQPDHYLNINQLREGELIDIINQMQFRLIEIPFTLHYKALVTERWIVTAFAGLGISMCSSAEYNVSTAVSKGRKYTLFLDNNDNQVFVTLDYNNGYKVDKSLSNNTYASTLLGTRVIYNAFKDFSLTADLNYRNMLGQIGFGPLDENYKSFSAGLGVVYFIR